MSTLKAELKGAALSPRQTARIQSREHRIGYLRGRVHTRVSSVMITPEDGVVSSIQITYICGEVRTLLFLREGVSDYSAYPRDHYLFGRAATP